MQLENSGAVEGASTTGQCLAPTKCTASSGRSCHIAVFCAIATCLVANTPRNVLADGGLAFLGSPPGLVRNAVHVVLALTPPWTSHREYARRANGDRACAQRLTTLPHC
jgi:hypothetical protein